MNEPNDEKSKWSVWNAIDLLLVTAALILVVWVAAEYQYDNSGSTILFLSALSGVAIFPLTLVRIAARFRSKNYLVIVALLLPLLYFGFSLFVLVAFVNLASGL